MAVIITHKKIATYPDEPSAEINKAEWNDDHSIDTAGASEGDVLTVVAGVADWAAPSDLAINDPVSGSTPSQALYVSLGGNLAQMPLEYDGAPFATGVFNLYGRLDITDSSTIPLVIRGDGGGASDLYFGANAVTANYTGLYTSGDTGLAEYNYDTSAYYYANRHIEYYVDTFGVSRGMMSAQYIAIGDYLWESGGYFLEIDNTAVGAEAIRFNGIYSDFNVLTARFGGDAEIAGYITAGTYITATDARQAATLEMAETITGLPALGLTDGSRNTVRIIPMVSGITVDRYQELQDRDGTIALIDDIPAAGATIPMVMAIASLRL
jgi:hypothetical protein